MGLVSDIIWDYQDEGIGFEQVLGLMKDGEYLGKIGMTQEQSEDVYNRVKYLLKESEKGLN